MRESIMDISPSMYSEYSEIIIYTHIHTHVNINTTLFSF